MVGARQSLSKLCCLKVTGGEIHKVHNLGYKADVIGCGDWS